MTPRLITCKKCNHKNRFGKVTCSYCFDSTSVWNRWWVIPLALTAVAFLVALSGTAPTL